MISIREANPADYPVIQYIAHQTWPDTFGKIISSEQIAYMLDWMYSIPALQEQVDIKGHRFLVATKEDEDMGYISYELNYKGSSKTKIHKIYILPSAQGKGIGKALFELVTAFAQQNGNTALLLNVNRQNPAVQFYEKQGFVVVAHENIDIGNGFLMEDYVMEKSL